MGSGVIAPLDGGEELQIEARQLSNVHNSGETEPGGSHAHETSAVGCKLIWQTSKLQYVKVCSIGIQF
jgi:hypothetical protein